MSKSKYTDRICIFILVVTLVITLGFMNGEQFGIVRAESDIASDEKGIFSDRDFEENWSEASASLISLDNMEHLTDKGAYVLNGDLYIVEKGIYVLSGKLENQQIIVNAKEAKIQIVLNNVEISEENQPAIRVEKADKIFLTLAEDSKNVITVGDIETSEEDGLPDAAIYCDGDLTINGSGALEVTVENGHGIKSKDDLAVTNGEITVKAGDTALLGKDSVRIGGGSFDLTAGADGIKSNNDTEEDKGYVTVTGGTFIINADHDGIQAETDVLIEGGEFSIFSGGGAENGKAHTQEFGMGGFGGDRSGKMFQGMFGGDASGDFTGNPQDGFFGKDSRGDRMNRGEMPADGSMPEMPDGEEMPKEDSDTSADAAQEKQKESAETTEKASEDDNTSDSFKGIKAGRSISISGGILELDCADDALHSDGNLEISSGEMRFAAGDDGVHAEDKVQISGGTLTVTQSYEGIEGNQILISDGIIELISTDDGMNASGGTAGYGFGRMRSENENTDEKTMAQATIDETTIDKSVTDGADEENADSDTLPLLHITGGKIHVNAAGDGLDSNGDMVIDGGSIIVDGPTNSGNGALDSGTESGGDCIVNGGTIIALGASGMAEGFTENSTQYSFNCIFSSDFNEGDEVTIADSEGTVIYTYTVQKSGNSIIFSSDDLREGETYTITVGSQSEEMTLTSVSNGSSYSMGRGNRFPSGL